MVNPNEMTPTTNSRSSKHQNHELPNIVPNSDLVPKKNGQKLEPLFSHLGSNTETPLREVNNGYPTGPNQFYLNQPLDGYNKLNFVSKRHQRLVNDISITEGHRTGAISMNDSEYNKESNPTLDLSSESYIAKIMDRPQGIEGAKGVTQSRKYLERCSTTSNNTRKRKQSTKQANPTKNPCFLNVYDSD